MRLVALDSIRGIAALTVVVFHSLLVFPELHEILDRQQHPYVWSRDLTALLLTVTPASLLWAGREAVLLFFVLSGFVLAQSFDGERSAKPGWMSFAAKRLFRLLPPCIVVSLMLGLLVPLSDPRPRPELSEWFNSLWTEPVTVQLLLGHSLLLLGEYTLNNPMWTLHYELRVSLLFPLLMLLTAAGTAVIAVAAAGGVLLCLLEMKLVGTGALTTLLFVPHFALGAVLARHRRSIAHRISAASAATRVGLWVLCYPLLIFGWLVPAGDLICALVNGVGAALLIAMVLASNRAQAALSVRPLPWLGAISYSLYLVHVPVLLAAVHMGGPDWPAWIIVAVSPIASIMAAVLLHHVVERPAILVGRRVGAWVGARGQPHGGLAHRHDFGARP